jgi:hypothetical protein
MKAVKWSLRIGLGGRMSNYQDYVIKDGKLIGDFEGLYRDFKDPWNQSRIDHILDSRRQLTLIICKKLKAINDSKKAIELGCGFGFITEQLREIGFTTIGTDIAAAAIDKAIQLHPKSEFKVANFDDAATLETFNPDIIIMAELSWYVLNQLDQFKSLLKEFASKRNRPTYFIHLLTTYAPGVQKYGNEKFTNLEEILEYFDMKFIEFGTISTVRGDDPLSQGTFFVAELN